WKKMSNAGNLHKVVSFLVKKCSSSSKTQREGDAKIETLQMNPFTSIYSLHNEAARPITSSPLIRIQRFISDVIQGF
ncbi:hypothetical protein A2U01_0053503, partial [Trifolium medium]|nr:hypothetical protein [Trifolium medium]